MSIKKKHIQDRDIRISRTNAIEAEKIERYEKAEKTRLDMLKSQQEFAASTIAQNDRSLTVLETIAAAQNNTANDARISRLEDSTKDIMAALDTLLKRGANN